MMIVYFALAFVATPFALRAWNEAARLRRRLAAGLPLLALPLLGCGPEAPQMTDGGETDAGADAPPDAPEPVACEPQTGNCAGNGCVDSLTTDQNCGRCGNDCAARGRQCLAVHGDVLSCEPIPCSAKGDACTAGDCPGTCDGVACVPACSDAGAGAGL